MDDYTLTQSKLDYALEQSLASIKRNIARIGKNKPIIGDGIIYKFSERDSWVEGFWPGQLWLAYSETKDRAYLDAARAYTPYFENRLKNSIKLDHDLGFLYTLTAVADFKLTNNLSAKATALKAADMLKARYQKKAKFILAWDNWAHKNNEGRMIIDSLENIHLLFWASSVTGDSSYKDIATNHCFSSAEHIVRNDGSSFHCFDFDPKTGQAIAGATHQGFNDSSCWSRGQSWGIHGFAQAYQYSHNKIFLETAQKMADYAIEHLPDDYIPVWDYNLPKDQIQYIDSSAAAITAAGLQLLALELGDKKGGAYKDVAYKIIVGLIDTCSTFAYKDAQGLLFHGARHVNDGDFDNMLPYGDYYFLEALLRAKGRTEFFW